MYDYLDLRQIKRLKELVPYKVLAPDADEIIEEIDKLNNVINELEEYINKNIEITKVAVAFNEGINDAYEVEKYKRDIDLFTMVLDKLKELKENKQ